MQFCDRNVFIVSQSTWSKMGILNKLVMLILVIERPTSFIKRIMENENFAVSSVVKFVHIVKVYA